MQNLFKSVQKARTLGLRLRDSEVYILSRDLLPDSPVLFDDGKHLFSALDVVSLGAMTFVYETLRQNLDILLQTDAAGYSALHYAAMYSFWVPFEDAISFAKVFGETSLRHVCLSSENESRQSVPSLLVEKDKLDLLHGLVFASLHVSPFETEFEDVCVTWLHEALLAHAKGTVVYLDKTHGQEMQELFQRSHNADPPEILSPMDIVLLHQIAPKKKHDCSFYVDQILSRYDFGLRVTAFSFRQLVLLTREGKLDGISNTYSPQEILDRCLADSVSSKLQ